MALQQTFTALARQFPSPSTPGSDRFWLPFGQGPWLLSLTADIGTRQPLLIAVDAAKAFDGLESATRCVAAGGCRLALAADAGPDDYPLGPALPGLTLLDVTSEHRTSPALAATADVLHRRVVAGTGALGVWRVSALARRPA